MDAHDIERYLAELGTELTKRGLTKPVRVLLIGGAYMVLLAQAPRSTKDIDIFWLDEEGFQQAYGPLRESTQMVTQKYHLDPDWLNYLTQMLLYDEVVVPTGKRWKTFGPLHIYVPTNDYIFALKITAGRQKDLEDCAILLPKTKIRTRAHAQQILDRYILPEGQQQHAETIAHALDQLFGRGQP